MSVVRPRPSPPRTAIVTLAVLFAVLAAPSPAAAATANDGLSDAERAGEAVALHLVQDARSAAGLMPLTVVDAVGRAARGRADDMRRRRYFAHAGPDGTTAFALLDRSGTPWTAASEAIGWNDVPDAAGSASRVVADWLASPEHREILLAADRDALGLASALDPGTGRRTWVLLTVARPAPSPPRLGLRVVSVGRADARALRTAVLHWSKPAPVPASGSAPGTAPVVSVTVQVRPAGGRWSTVVRGSASATLRVRLRAPGAFEVRIRATGPAGAPGPWTVVRVRP